MTAGPTLSLPNNGAVSQSLTLSLSWGAVSSATSYQVQLALESTFAEPVADITIPGTSLDLAAQVGALGYPLDFFNIYYWRVRGFIGQAPTDWSASRSFATETGVLPFAPIHDHVAQAQDLLLQQFKGGVG